MRSAFASLKLRAGNGVRGFSDAGRAAFSWACTAGCCATPGDSGIASCILNSTSSARGFAIAVSDIMARCTPTTTSPCAASTANTMAHRRLCRTSPNARLSRGNSPHIVTPLAGVPTAHCIAAIRRRATAVPFCVQVLIPAAPNARADRFWLPRDDPERPCGRSGHRRLRKIPTAAGYSSPAGSWFADSGQASSCDFRVLCPIACSRRTRRVPDTRDSSLSTHAIALRTETQRRETACLRGSCRTPPVVV